MQVKSKYFYFGKVPAEQDTVEFPEGWEPGWYYRFFIDDELEDIIVEEMYGVGKTHIAFSDVWEFTQTLNKVQQEIICASIGAPIPNA